MHQSQCELVVNLVEFKGGQINLPGMSVWTWGHIHEALATL
jgi:hypothetical protein